MFFIWGPETGVSDLGVVAELCPQCAVVRPCRVFGKVQGLHVFFVPVLSGVTEAISICSQCDKRIQCDMSRYKTMLPLFEAFSLSVEELLDRTNPALKAKIEWSRRCEELGNDPRFMETLRSVDELRPGSLKARLSHELRRWNNLDEAQRADLIKESSELARAMKFAMSISTQLPENAGCAIGSLICLAVWVVSYFVPIDWNNGMLMGAVLAGPLIGSAVYQFIETRRVRRWIGETLVPEAQKSGIGIQYFAALLKDLPPPTLRTSDVLRPLQQHSETIRSELKTFEGSIDPHANRASDSRFR